ncbi:sigma-54 dependent transcriptional regulator/response regulator FleR, partial [Pseudomonas syringae pv. actinidiae ICMP 19096]
IQAQDFCLAGPVTSLPVAVPSEALPPQPVISSAESAGVGVGAESAGALGDDLRRREFQMIIDTLRAERGRRKEAAERLGISPRTLRYKLAQMRDAGMDVEGYLFAT